MPKRIVYRDQNDVAMFDKKRFIESLKRYGEINGDAVSKVVAEYAPYDPLHVSCLVEMGTKLLANDDAAKKYFEDHQEWFAEIPEIERLRRITGYLVGTLSRWNDGKKAEEKARVKHNLPGQYTKDEKDEIERIKLENSVMSQI